MIVAVVSKKGSKIFVISLTNFRKLTHLIDRPSHSQCLNGMQQSGELLFAEMQQNEMAMLCVRVRLVSERSESLLKELPFLISGSGPEQLIRENYLAIIRSSCISTKSWY